MFAIVLDHDMECSKLSTPINLKSCVVRYTVTVGVKGTGATLRNSFLSQDINRSHASRPYEVQSPRIPLSPDE